MGIWFSPNYRFGNGYVAIGFSPLNILDPGGLDDVPQRLWHKLNNYLQFNVTRWGVSEKNHLKRGLYDCGQRSNWKAGKGKITFVGTEAAKLGLHAFRARKVIKGKSALKKAAKESLKRIGIGTSKRIMEELKEFKKKGWTCERAKSKKNKCGCEVILCFNSKTNKFKAHIEGVVGKKRHMRSGSRHKTVPCDCPLHKYAIDYSGTATWNKNKKMYEFKVNKKANQVSKRFK